MSRLYSLSLFVSIVGTCVIPSPARQSHDSQATMSQVEQNKNVVRRFVEEVWNQRQVNLCDELVDTAIVGHYAGREIRGGLPRTKEIANYWCSALSGFTFHIEDIFGEGDRVVAHIPFEGTHVKNLLGIDSTGRKVKVDEMLICRLKGGKIAEVWEAFDEYGLRKQLTASAPGRKE